MPVKIEANAEPLPGYRLIERLGGGGFGEVWKAEAPGGLLKAIKFVYGDLCAADEDGSRAEQELKALSRVKTVRQERHVRTQARDQEQQPTRAGKDEVAGRPQVGQRDGVARPTG